MTNGGKNKSVTFIILFSVYIYIYIYMHFIDLKLLNRYVYIFDICLYVDISI